MVNTTKLEQNSWLQQSGVILFFVACLILLSRVFLRGSTLELDEAEQVVMAQLLSPGYPDQPPLYSWLQYAFFHFFGCNLVSLALLKSILLFGCLCAYHQICRLFCQSLALAWCATAAWVLVLPISLDLIKDNTHSVLALLAACLTWYWFVAPSRLNKVSWYLVLGFIIGIGFLSKFNYLLFLSLLVISGISLSEYRAKLFSPYLLLSLITSLVIASPYIFWLQQHFSLGFRSVYKLAPEDKQLWYGFVELIIAILLFIVPSFLVSFIFFPIKLNLKRQDPLSRLFFRFHLISFPFLIGIMLLASIKSFESRWLIPILFLSPLLFFGKVQAKEAFAARVRTFLTICILLQISFLMALLYREQHGNKIRNRLPLQQIVQAIKNEHQNIIFIVSDSHWLIGNLMQSFPKTQGWLLHPASQPLLPEGSSLLIWQNSTPPFWVNLFAQSTQLSPIQFIEDPKNHKIIAGYTFVFNSPNQKSSSRLIGPDVQIQIGPDVQIQRNSPIFFFHSLLSPVLKSLSQTPSVLLD